MTGEQQYDGQSDDEESERLDDYEGRSGSESAVKSIRDAITVLLWAFKLFIASLPMLAILGVFFIGLLVVLDTGIIEYVPIFDEQHEGYFNLAFWYILGSIVPAIFFAWLYYRQGGRKIFANNAPNGGNGGGYELSDGDWEDLDVYRYDDDAERYKGEKLTRDAIHYNGDYYEAIAYYPDENAAVVSGWGNRSMYELRQHESKLEALMTDVYDMFKAAVDMDARRQQHATEDAAREANRVIRDFERESLAEGELPDSPVREHIDKITQQREEDDQSLRGEYQIPDRDRDNGGGEE